MTQPRYVIGLDGGGTKTAAALCALDGALLAEAQGGPSNMQVIGVEKAAETILDLVASCCHSIGCTPDQIGSVVAGLSGAGRTSDQGLMVEAIRQLAAGREMTLDRVAVESDARIALEGALTGKPGIIVIAGTGSIVYGKDARGGIHRSGGWGRIVGDEGSGYAIGSMAFHAVARMLDGRDKKTMLHRLFERTHALGTQEAIINAVYRQGFDIASVAPLVMAAAEKGDPHAKRILAKGRDDLVEVIETCLKMLTMNKRSPERIPLAFIGGLLTNENIYSRKVRSTIRRRLPRIHIQPAESSPVIGAALLAIKLARR